MDFRLVFWTFILLIPLVWLVRQVHQGLQELFFLLTGHKGAAIYLFQILLLPGVALHEFSHYLVARLLGVRVLKVSLQPQIHAEKIQLGAIVLDRPDFIRGLLIGMAPLVLGSATVVLIGKNVFDVGGVISAATTNDTRGLIEAMRGALDVNDAWIWLYLTFAISNAMLPSESDREALWPMAAFLMIVVGLAAVAGWGPALGSTLAEPMEQALSLLLLAFGITLFVDAVFAALIMLLRASVSLLTGRTLEKNVG